MNKLVKIVLPATGLVSTAAVTAATIMNNQGLSPAEQQSLLEEIRNSKNLAKVTHVTKQPKSNFAQCNRIQAENMAAEEIPKTNQKVAQTVVIKEAHGNSSLCFEIPDGFAHARPINRAERKNGFEAKEKKDFEIVRYEGKDGQEKYIIILQTTHIDEEAIKKNSRVTKIPQDHITDSSGNEKIGKSINQGQNKHPILEALDIDRIYSINLGTQNLSENNNAQVFILPNELNKEGQIEKLTYRLDEIDGAPVLIVNKGLLGGKPDIYQFETQVSKLENQ